MTARPLSHHRVPPSLLMVMRRDEITALARWNDHRTDNLAMAIEQWRFNVATREALLDAGAMPLADGGFVSYEGGEAHRRAWDWHFPQEPRACPDEGACHHGCGPLSGCWRVTWVWPLTRYGRHVWAPADKIAHEHTDGLL